MDPFLAAAMGYLGNRQAVTTLPRQRILSDHQGASKKYINLEEDQDLSGVVINIVFKLKRIWGEA